MFCAFESSKPIQSLQGRSRSLHIQEAKAHSGDASYPCYPHPAFPRDRTRGGREPAKPATNNKQKANTYNLYFFAYKFLYMCCIYQSGMQKDWCIYQSGMPGGVGGGDLGVSNVSNQVDL